MILPRPLVPAVILGTSVLACSGAEKDTTPPVLQAVAVADANIIRLTFSEAMVVGEANPAAFRLSLAVKDAQSTVYYGLEYEGLSYDGSDDGPISDGDPSATSMTGSMSGSGSATEGGGTYGTTYTSTYTTNDSYYPDPTGYDAGGYEDGGYARPGAPDDLRRPIPTRLVSDLGITELRAVEGQPNQVDLVLAGRLADAPACAELATLMAESGKAGIFVHHAQGTGSPTDAAGNAPADLGAHWVEAISKAYVELQGDFPNLDPYLPIGCT